MTTPIISEFATIEEILSFAMKEEKDAYDFYMAAAERMADPDLKQFLIHLAETEIEHFTVLERKLDEYKANNFSSKAIMSSFDEED